MGRIVHSKPTITMFTDASVKKIGARFAAGFGGWAKGDGRKACTHSGPAQGHKNVGVAELDGICSMLKFIQTTGYLQVTDVSLMIQSDSLWALNQLYAYMNNTFESQHVDGAAMSKTQKPAVAHGVMPMLGEINTIVGLRGVVYLRHVRAHKGHSTTRHTVNEMCDKLAKNARLEVEARY
jgi:ribonuclease HI